MSDAAAPDTAWRSPPPGRLIGPGHTAGDFLGAPEWRVLEERTDSLRAESEIRHRRGRNVWVQTRFLDVAGTPLVDATTVLRELS